MDKPHLRAALDVLQTTHAAQARPPSAKTEALPSFWLRSAVTLIPITSLPSGLSREKAGSCPCPETQARSRSDLPLRAESLPCLGLFSLDDRAFQVHSLTGSDGARWTADRSWGDICPLQQNLESRAPFASSEARSQAVCPHSTGGLREPSAGTVPPAGRMAGAWSPWPPETGRSRLPF